MRSDSSVVKRNTFLHLEPLDDALDEKEGSVRRCTSVPCTWKPRRFNYTKEVSDAALPTGRVCLEVHNVNGEMLTFEVEASMTVSKLKHELARRCNVPPVCQQLALDTTAISMESDIPLACLVDPSDPESRLSLTLVVSADYAVQAVSNSQNAERQLEALRGLMIMGPKGGESAVAAIIQCFTRTSHDCVVRKAAVIALMEVVPQGDGVGIDELCSACMWEPAPQVRVEALRALMHTAAKVDEQVIVCLGCCLQDEDINVRSEAIDLIARAANVDCHERIMSEIKPRLEHQHAFVRSAALQTLARVAEKGDHFAVPLVVSRLEDTDDSTRCAALRALSRMVDRGDLDAMTAAAARLEDASADVRCAAVESISHIANRGDGKACALLKACLEDRDLAVKESASIALSQVAATDADGSDSNLTFRSSLWWPPAHSWETPHSLGRQAGDGEEQQRLRIPRRVQDLMEKIELDVTRV